MLNRVSSAKGAMVMGCSALPLQPGAPNLLAMVSQLSNRYAIRLVMG
jgi:hypothetical protein